MVSLDEQRRVAKVLLSTIGDAGFALAGASAIREHGLTNRPTEDVDLFASPETTPDQFKAAVTVGEEALRSAGYSVRRIRDLPAFVRVQVENSAGTMDVDFAVNWRADLPVVMTLGLVLSERDAVAGKLSAVYSRGEARDFLDLDAIRTSGHYTDDDLLALGHEDDDGFDDIMFAQQLNRATRLLPSQVAEYGTTPDELQQIQSRIAEWSRRLSAKAIADASLTERLRERELAIQPDVGSADIDPRNPDTLHR